MKKRSLRKITRISRKKRSSRKMNRISRKKYSLKRQRRKRKVKTGGAEPEPEPDPEQRPRLPIEERDDIHRNLMDEIFPKNVFDLQTPNLTPHQKSLKQVEMGDVGFICGHGSSLPSYIVVPDGITLYLYTGAGEDLHVGRISASDAEKTRTELGSLKLSLEEKKVNLKEQEATLLGLLAARRAEGAGDEAPEARLPQAALIDLLGRGGTDAEAALPIYNLRREVRELGIEIEDVGNTLKKFEEKLLKMTHNRFGYLRKYQPGAIIQNHTLDFNLIHTETQMGHKFGDNQIKYSYGGIIAEENKAYINPNGIEEIYRLRDASLEEYSPELGLEKHNNDYIPKEVMIGSILAGEGAYFTLDDILKIISQKSDPKPSKWICSFCRSGTPLDLTVLQECYIEGLERLGPDFFSKKITYEGVSDELMRGSSLASSVSPQYFIEIVRELQGYEGNLNDILPGSREKLSGIVAKIDSFQALLPEEVCFVFLMRNHIAQ
jgi:hypothetical protein